MSVSRIIYPAIHTLHNPATAKACLRVHIRNCLIVFCLYHWWSSSNSRSINYVIKAMWSYCDTIAIGDTSYRHELIRSPLSTNRFVSPRSSESALSYTHRKHNGVTIASNDRTLNLTTLHWRHIYINLQLSSFAIYQMESIPRHSGPMSWVLFAHAQWVCLKYELIRISPFGRHDSNISIFG